MNKSNIKKVPWIYEPEISDKNNNHYVSSMISAICPFCQKKNHEFAQEKITEQFGKDRFRTLGNGKCEHFHYIDLERKIFLFKNDIEIKNLPDKIIKRKMISIDDFEFDFWDLYNDLSTLEDVTIFHEFSISLLGSRNIKEANLICTSSRGHCYLSDKGKRLLEILRKIKMDYDY